MYVKQPKKLLILNILDILRKYSDEDHRLSQREIGEILKTEYGMTADRKAIRRNLSELLECGYPIEYSETLRSAPVKGPDGRDKLGPDGKPLREETTILSDFYLERQFTDGELRLLIDGLLFSRHVPYSQCRELVEKLEGLSNIYFRSRVGHIARLPVDQSDNKQLFLNIEMLDEAISKGRKVRVSLHGVRPGQEAAPACPAGRLPAGVRDLSLSDGRPGGQILPDLQLRQVR